MYKHEKRLLDNLENDNLSQDIPLKNVKEGLGEVAYVVGNPLTKTEISLQITTQFFQGGGVGIIAPAALPVQLQTSLPVFIFGLTDYYGGYLRSLQLVPLVQPWVQNAPVGDQFIGIWNVTRMGTMTGLLPQSGDMVFSYTAFLPPFAPADFYACDMIIRCTNLSYGTFLNSFVSDLITIDTIRYIVPIANVNQLINPIIFGTQTLFGKVKSDNIDPRMYITSKDFQQQIADIPINLPIDKTLMIGFQIDVFCQQLSWVLFVKKVESLTHKR